MSPGEFRSTIERIERDASERVALLSAVPARARPASGESGIIADAVASMARRERNRAEIEAIERERDRAIESVEAAFYGITLEDE